MKSQLVHKSVDQAVIAWDLYCAGEYGSIAERFSEEKSPEIKDLYILAMIEQEPDKEHEPTGESLFSPLVEGMISFHAKEYKLTTSILGSWLLNKTYFSPLVLKRFLHAAKLSDNHALVYAIARKYVEWKSYRSLVIEPLFSSCYHLGKHQEVLELFEQYRELLNESMLLHKVAFSLMELKRYHDAERLLVALYERITGVEYEIQYEKVKKRYEAGFAQLPELERKSINMNFNQKMELGLTYLFNERYNDALRIFKSIS